MENKKEVWRWNADSVWHYFCSMQYEAFQGKIANNEFMRYHHVRSCIIYSVNVIEALLNQEMRHHLENEGLPEANIYKRLRTTPLHKKRDEWPSEICGKKVIFGPDVVDIFETYRSIRDELTHPKRRDHSIYVELDQANPDKLVDAIARAIVTFCVSKSVPFPYWVLGWNYVGMNNNPAFPFQGNNMNLFIWSLRGMGFDVNVNDNNWDKTFMASIAGYEALKEALGLYPNDIEPYWHDFPTRPRLTRRWWDDEFINTNLTAARKASGEDD